MMPSCAWVATLAQEALLEEDLQRAQLAFEPEAVCDYPVACRNMR